MTTFQTIALSVVASAPIASVFTAWFVRRTETARIKVESRKAIAADWHLFSSALAARVTYLETRQALADEKAERDARIKRILGDHIDLLEAYIWEKKPPPPPPRPTS